MDTGIQGKVALVTGGSRGIGAEICRELAKAGCKVIVNYSSNKTKAEEVSNEISSVFGVETVVCGFDVGNEEQVESSLKEVTGKIGGIDILVNNAGITGDGLFVRTKLEDWEKVLRTNLTGSFLCSRAVIKHMMKARWGRIVNLSSVVGEMGNPGQASYCASKSALFGLTKSLAKEVGSRGITVNCVAPGFIKTDMTSELNEEQTKSMLANIPLGALGEASDIAMLVAFLAGKGGAYITGQVLGVNGGMYM